MRSVAILRLGRSVNERVGAMLIIVVVDVVAMIQRLNNNKVKGTGRKRFVLLERTITMDKDAGCAVVMC